MEYHVPVLLKESVDGLNILNERAEGVYVDVTFGGGGHSREILNRMKGGKLFSFDQDEEAQKNVPQDERIQFVKSNFRHLKDQLKSYNVLPIHGIIADLGVSSRQLDSPERGFSFRFDEALDMRMNQDDGTMALDILQDTEQKTLMKILGQYGEVHKAGRIARVIKENLDQIKTTGDLVKYVELAVGTGKGSKKEVARVFQALRIKVNDEMGALEDLLEQSIGCLAPGGRLVVISYHSLEDRLVKRFMKSGNINGEVKKDFYGNTLSPFTLINNKVLFPNEEEMKINPRSRSARLRIAELKTMNE